MSLNFKQWLELTNQGSEVEKEIPLITASNKGGEFPPNAKEETDKLRRMKKMKKR